MHMLVNAGYISPDGWVQNPEIGGGRIIGEACHFIDLMLYLTESKINTVSATMTGERVATREDKMSITLGFEDGSVGTVNYFANGSKSYPKEQLQIFSDERVLEIENFRRTVGYGFKGFKNFKTFRQDKGHTAEFAAFVERLRSGGEAVIPLDELINVTLATFAAMKSASEHRTIVISQEFHEVLCEDVS
jgi:predicted dehydrogenase